MCASRHRRAHTEGVRSVAILTITGLVALVVAVLTGSTPLAVIVVALAITGIVLLLRDWRDDRGRPVRAEPVIEDVAPVDSDHLRPDEFSPDISTDPDGPSSDARADQR
jgi:hypothetical protein